MARARLLLPLNAGKVMNTRPVGGLAETVWEHWVLAEWSSRYDPLAFAVVIGAAGLAPV